MKKALLFALALSVATIAPAQVGPEYFLPGDVTYNKSVPLPSAVTGHQPGEWHLTHDQLVEYMKLLSDLSDRAQWEEYARSWEGRPLGNLIITSAENMKKIEEIRTQHLKLSDPAASGSADLSGMPVIIKLGYGIHGNESSAQNASVLAAYYLVAGEGEKIDRILSNAVILIDPALNPDGMQRHSTWVNMYRGMTLTTDPASREFNEAWPGGRTNHYWFDLNRDYIMLQHPETVGRVEAFFRWMPNINTDHHEMGANSTFFFQPGVQSRNNPVVPIENQKMTALIGNYHARFLDNEGSLYYTEESFDDFYLGKGSAYPDVHGSVGILFEQAGVKGHLREAPDGLLSFPFAIKNQFTVSLSTIEAGLDLRIKLLEMQRDFYTSALKEADSNPVRGFVFSTACDKTAGGKFIENLMRHHIDVYTCSKNMTKNGQTYSSADSYFVPLKQKEYRFIRSLFEPVTKFTDTAFYDISTWVLPMSFNISYTSLSAGESSGLAGTKLTAPPMPSGSVTGAAEPYAWLFEWKEYYSPRALYMIQKAGLTARVATRPFRVSENGVSRDYGYGTVMVHSREGNTDPAEVRKTMENVAAACGIEIHGVSSGLTQGGIDLGSNEFIPLAMPSVLMVIDEGIPSGEAGEIWHLLDVRYGMQVSMMPAARLAGANLNRYNVIIMTGNPSTSSAVAEKIAAWSRSGGTIIACNDGNRWVSANKLAEIEFIPEAKLPEGDRRYADRSAERALQTIPGSIFETKLDLTHPMCYGYTKPLLPVFKSDATAARPGASPYGNPVKYTDAPLLSGYSTPENNERIKNSAYVTVQQGQARVISIYDDTNFRAIWFGTSKIFANAVFFGQILRPEGRYDQ